MQSIRKSCNYSIGFEVESLEEVLAVWYFSAKNSLYFTDCLPINNYECSLSPRVSVAEPNCGRLVMSDWYDGHVIHLLAVLVLSQSAVHERPSLLLNNSTTEAMAVTSFISSSVSVLLLRQLTHATVAYIFFLGGGSNNLALLSLYCKLCYAELQKCLLGAGHRSILG